MKKINSSFKVLAALLLMLCSTSVFAQNKMVAYVPNWINLNTFSNTIDYSKLTHINIAFENPVNSAGDLSFNSQNNVLINKAHANNVKVLISIGGGSASGDQTLLARYAMLTNNTNRAAFVAKLSAYVSTHNFDGLDVDLEGPNINGDYGAFIAALSAALKPKGKLLTSALSQGYGGGNVPNSVFQYMDFINIMAYDGAGYWQPNVPGQHSSFAYAKSNTEYWLNRGLPKEKAVLGVPFYGYGFGNAFRNRDYPYKEIIASYPGAETKDQVGSTIWYNGIPTIKAKTNYAFDIKIGGMMIWSLDYDGTGDKSLLSAMDEVFKQRSVVVPQSPYNGVRINLPGKLEVENYDLGGQNVAYNDLTAGNSGAVYRTDGVDVQATTDTGGGYNLGWVEAGEWLEYSVNVTTAGVYKLDIRSASTAGAIRVEVDGADVTGSIALPNTGAYQTWATTTKTGVSLPAGQHILRIVVLTGGFNLNHITFSNAPNVLPTVSLTYPVNNTSFTAPASITINASASDADGSVSKVDFYNGTTLLSSDAVAPYSFVWTNVAAGTYSITARATDNSNAVGTSSAVTITVTPPTPLCLPVSASADDGNIPANVLDNNTATRWSANGDGQWIQFCQGSAITMRGVQIAFYSGNARQSVFDVQVSQNGSDWTNVLTNVRSSGTSLALENFTFTAQSAKYLRVVGHGNTLNTWNSYTEVKVLTGETPVNQLPSVSITSPTSNASFNAPASIAINASASDADGTISKVDFYSGTTLLFSDNTAPYSYNWTSVVAGTYSITARATDNSGASTTTDAVSVKVNAVVNNTCSAIAQYIENGNYVAGSKVKNGNAQYQCKPYPYSGWCNGSAWAYAPGAGAYWSDAWTLIGSCNAARTGEDASNASTMVSSAPNPFVSSTDIQVVVAEAGEVSVLVYNKEGQVVGTVVEGYLTAGTHTFTFDATALTSDLYLIKYHSASGVATQKMLKVQ
ncbi:MAG: chiA1 3 [Cytophagaceae bacterium]|jgi:GH18 family chitinase/flagellar hook assembly protein FlgD|nr:chiA1 3 [Cytophagaceae bacterium]